MGCSSCSTGKDGKPSGCNSNGGCSTGGCNRLNTYDWLASLDIQDTDGFDLVEVSFKNGARKAFYHNEPHTRAIIGDMVVVDGGNGYDIGRISLTGELVRLQMKKKKVNEDAPLTSVIRIANERDLERLDEARSKEKRTLIRARAIARTLNLDMKIGDIEFQGDNRKATFFYTADGRVDFRELIRHFAQEFKVKIEMRQIGVRQESARIGGIGSCGRELCCSTWLSDFKSVSTAAARYQNLAINQSKLSGQCGRLKCCLNYELDSYMDAIKDFPKQVEYLKLQNGKASLMKTDIFKRIMYYYVTDEGSKMGKVQTASVDRIKEIKAMNKKGEFPVSLIDFSSYEVEEKVDFDDNLTGVVELPPEEKKKKGRNRNKNRNKGRNNNNNNNNKSGDRKPKPENKKRNDNRNKNKDRKSDSGKNTKRVDNKDKAKDSKPQKQQQKGKNEQNKKPEKQFKKVFAKKGVKKPVNKDRKPNDNKNDNNKK